MAAAAPYAGAQAASQNSRAEARAARAGKGGMRHGLLRGVKLSADEKAKVKSVHEKYAVQTKPMRESLKAAMQEARADRQKGDTAAAHAVLARTQKSRESLRAVMQQEKTEIRSALTPSNQKQFDANAQKAVAEHGKKGKGLGRRRAKAANA